jgi:hypothetical protein
MNKNNWNLLSNITFKTQNYHRNFDLINVNENFITEYDGTISEVRLNKRKPPRPVGKYGFSIWNIGLGEKFAVDFNLLIKDHAFEDTYHELINIIKKNEININKYNKIVLIHTLILNKDYRKQGITEEFIEMMYRNFYAKDVAIIMLVKPFQDNSIDADFYLNHKRIIIKDSLSNENNINISAFEYYSLNELLEKNDVELNEYKLFNVANRCGFQRINDSYLFIFKPKKIENRISKKQNWLQQTDNE